MVACPSGTRSAVGGHNVLYTRRRDRKAGPDRRVRRSSGEAADIARDTAGAPRSPPRSSSRIASGASCSSRRTARAVPRRRRGATGRLHRPRRDGDRQHQVTRRGRAARGRAGRAAAGGDARRQGRPPGGGVRRVAEETALSARRRRVHAPAQRPRRRRTNVGCWGETIAGVFPVGTHFVPEPAGDGVAAIVLRTGRPYRIDDYSAVPIPSRGGALERGIGSAVGCPIVVRGAVWGAIFVTGAERFPPETELRLTQFADLVATAVANAEARAEIVRLAEEQAAQRRVATLVAQGAAAAEIFSAVTDEVGRLFDTELAIVGRLEEDPPAWSPLRSGRASKESRSDALEARRSRGCERVFRSRRAVRATRGSGQRSAALADTSTVWVSPRWSRARSSSTAVSGGR